MTGADKNNDIVLYASGPHKTHHTEHHWRRMAHTITFLNQWHHVMTTTPEQKDQHTCYHINISDMNSDLFINQALQSPGNEADGIQTYL